MSQPGTGQYGEAVVAVAALGSLIRIAGRLQDHAVRRRIRRRAAPAAP